MTSRTLPQRLAPYLLLGSVLSCTEAATQPAPPPPAPQVPARSPAPAPPRAAVPLETKALRFVNVPALATPRGVRRAIGIEAWDAAALSPAGDVLAVVDGTSGVQLIHVPTRRGLAHRADLACPPRDGRPCIPKVAFAADGARVAVWWPTNRLVVMSVPSGTTELDVTVESSGVLTFLRDGRLVVANKNVAYAFDRAGTRSEILEAKGVLGAISDDGRWALVESSPAKVVDVVTHTETAVPAEASVLDARFANNAVVATTTGSTRDLISWQPGSTKVTKLGGAHRSERLKGFAIGPAGDEVFVVTDTGLRVRGLDGTERLKSPWLTDEIPAHGVAAFGGETVVLQGACPFRLDARGDLVPGPVVCAPRVARIGFDGTRVVALPWAGEGVVAYDEKTGEIVASRRFGPVVPANGVTLAAVLRDERLGQRVLELASAAGHRASWATLSRDGARLFIGNESANSKIIDLADGRTRTTLPFVVSGDGTRLAMLNGEGTRVEIKRTADERLVTTLPTPSFLIDRMALTEDGRLFLAESEKMLVVRDVATGRVVFEPRCSTPFAVARTGKVLACTTSAGVEVYDLATKRLRRRIANEGGVDALALSDDGKHLALGAGSILVVDL